VTYLITHQTNDSEQCLKTGLHPIIDDPQIGLQHSSFKDATTPQNFPELDPIQHCHAMPLSFNQQTMLRDQGFKDDGVSELAKQQSVQYQSLVSLENLQHIDVVNASLAALGIQLSLESGYQCF